MATLKDYRYERLRKLAEIKALGVDPYPAKTARDTQNGDVIRSFKKLEGKTVTVAGRIISIRKFGKIAFIVLRDYSGEVQLFLRDGDLDASDGLGNDLSNLRLLDTGDFVEATGEVGKTKTSSHSESSHRNQATS